MSAAERWDEFRDLPPLLKPAEVAQALRLTLKAVYSMKERGQLPGVVQTGAKRFLVRKAALLSWLGQRQAPSPTGER